MSNNKVLSIVVGKKGKGKLGSSGPKPAVAFSLSAPPAPSRRKRKKGKSRGQGNPAVAQFLASLESPLCVAPPILGYQSFGPLAAHSAWLRLIGGTVQATSTSFAAFLTPRTLTAGTIGTYHNFFGCSDGLVATPYSTNATSYVPANGTTIAAAMETFRPVTAGFRATVRWNSGSTPGRLFAFSTTILANDLTPATFGTLAGLACMRPVPVIGSGTTIAEVSYRAGDEGDFELLACPTKPLSNTSYGICGIVGIGWPAAGFVVDYDVISHVEGQAGTGNEPDADNQPLSITTSMEALAALARPIPFYKDAAGVSREIAAFTRASSRRVTMTQSAASAAAASLQGMAHAATRIMQEDVQSTLDSSSGSTGQTIRGQIGNYAVSAGTTAVIGLAATALRQRLNAAVDDFHVV